MGLFGRPTGKSFILDSSEEVNKQLKRLQLLTTNKVLNENIICGLDLNFLSYYNTRMDLLDWCKVFRF